MRSFPPNFQLYVSSAHSAKSCWSLKVELENISWWKFCKWKIHANVNSFRSGKAQNRKISPYIYFLLFWNSAFSYESLHKYLLSSVSVIRHSMLGDKWMLMHSLILIPFTCSSQARSEGRIICTWGSPKALP